ncbi:MAG: caspase family protein [Terracidiphilus sp.]
MPTKSALLIGIDIYSHPSDDVKVPDGAPPIGRYEPQLTYRDLKGPSHDVAAMRDLLTSEKFGFPNDDQHIHILLNQAATRDAILKAMQQYLVQDPKPGDTVVLFISSHGSLRADPKGHGQRYDLDGTGLHPSYVENTIVPYDWYLGQDDIFSRDLRHIFNQAADRGIHLTAIFDSCHSGSLARGAENTALVARDFDFDPRPMPDDPYPAEAAGTPPESRKDNPVLVLSAAQKDQSAIDVQDGVPPHGLFTDALLETLQALPANRPASDVFKRLQVAMELAPGATNQQPELDTSDTRKEQAFFGGPAGSGPPTAAIVSADAKGVLLDIGTIADIGKGSEFTELTESNGARAVLQVTDSIGPARSRATVISPAGATVHAKDIVQLTKWVPAQRPALSFYAGASNPSLAEIEGALTVLRAANVKLAADPSSDPWTHHLAWDGTHWTLSTHSQKTSAGQVRKENPVTLGAKLSPGALKKLPAAAIVWFDAPLPKEWVPGLLPPPAGNEPPSAAQITSDRSQATYVIAGTPTGARIGYAWFKRSDVDAEVQRPKEIGAGCSPNSPYPLRTDWVDAGGENSPASGLTDSAVQLARLNGWLHLGSSSLGGQADFPYRLTLRRVSEEKYLGEGGNTYTGEYELWLVGNAKAAASPRWVYVLGIDCQGKGTLLWPFNQVPPGKFPTDKGRLGQIPLPGDPFPVSEPLGTDTYVLLTTSTPLADASALEFKGVVTRGAKSATPVDPLEELLDATSAGTRGASRPTPTNWSVQTIQTQSLAEAPPPTPASGKPQ